MRKKCFFECPYCEYWHKKEWLLIEHIREKHPEEIYKKINIK